MSTILRCSSEKRTESDDKRKVKSVIIRSRFFVLVLDSAVLKKFGSVL